MRIRSGAAGMFLAVITTGQVAGQGYRLRLESRVEAVSFRGITADSIARSQVIDGPNGGLVTPDGYAVDCTLGSICRYFRPGPERRGGPLISRADLLLWGFGVTGLTVHLNARYATDLGDQEVWPGISPSGQLIEGYAEYLRGSVTVRAGRQLLPGRLGLSGIDGGRVEVTLPEYGLDAALYGGWGLARGSALPVTSPALNPLDDFQPRDRQLVAGADVAWRNPLADVRAEYRREVDPASDYFVSERAALSASGRPVTGLLLFGSADWDLAQGFLGSAEARATYAHRWGTLSAGIRRYRPFFDLWTIWGAFSPVPYTSYSGSASVKPSATVEVRVRGERYDYAASGAETALSDLEDHGWRWSLGGSWTPHPRWSLDVDTQREFGPGAASTGLDGRVSHRHSDAITVAVHAGWLQRPLEFRYSDADVSWIGADLDLRPSDRWNITLRAARYGETRDRPDAAAFDWNQFRLTARVSLMLRSNADRAWLPPPLGASGGQGSDR